MSLQRVHIECGDPYACCEDARDPEGDYYYADEVDAVIDAATEMLAMLKRLEWAGTQPLAGSGVAPALSYRKSCHVCKSLKLQGHAPDCELAALIAQAEGE